MLTKSTSSTVDAGKSQALVGISPDHAWIALGGLFGLLGVVAGAAGVHVLEGTLDADSLDTFETAVRFQMYHAIALLAVGALVSRWQNGSFKAAGWLFTAGIILFSGSLYLLAVTDVGLFGAIAPLGGLSLIAGWAALIFGAVQRDSSTDRGEE